MIVELLIFSGRPNPAWQSMPQEAAQIRGRITCERLVPGPLPPSGLGYAGFSIRDVGADAGGRLMSEIRVHGGTIAIATADGVRYCADIHGLENYLLQVAQLRRAFPVGFESLYHQ